MKLQFPHHPIHLRGQSGFILMLFTLCMACSLWLMLILDANQARLSQQKLTPQQQVLEKYGPPASASATLTRTDDFSKKVDSLYGTTTSQIGGTIISAEPAKNDFTVEWHDSAGKTIQQNVQYNSTTSIAIQPTNVRDPYKPAPVSSLIPGSFVTVRGKSSADIISASLILIEPITQPLSPTPSLAKGGK